MARSIKTWCRDVKAALHAEGLPILEVNPPKRNTPGTHFLIEHVFSDGITVKNPMTFAGITPRNVGKTVKQVKDKYSKRKN